jgi:tripartite-type tricarboxylate transporter receptor subunit TctC
MMLRVLSLLLALLCANASAQTYPSKPVRPIVTYAPGGSSVVEGKFADLGVEAVSSTPEQFGSFIKSETDKYARLIKDTNMKVNP